MSGFVLNIDQKLINQLTQADALVKQLGVTSERTRDQFNKAFSDMATIGVDGLIKRLTEAQTKIAELGGSMSTGNGLGTISTQATQSSDAINRLIQTLTQLSSTLATSQQQQPMLKITEQDLGVGRMKAIKKAQMDEMVAQQQAASQMQIQIIKGEVATQIATLKSGYAVQIQEAKNAGAEKVRAAKEAAKAAEKARIAELTTFRGAMDFSKSTKSIKEQMQAIKYLKAAREKLSKEGMSEADYRNKVKQLTDEIKRQQTEVNKLVGKNSNLGKSHKSLINYADQLKRAFTGMLSISAIKGYVTQLVHIRAEFEKQHRALQVLLQDQKQANILWDKTVQLAVKSPYTVRQLVTYTKQLAAYRIESDKLYDTNRRLADISIGLGVDMNRLILAFGQVRAANFLRGTELRQFTEAGIPMLDELAKYYSKIEKANVTAAQVFERISKRKVLFTDVEAVINKMTDAGGTFYKMQEQLSNTLSGTMLNLKDQYELALNEIGKSSDGLIKFFLGTLKYLVENWRTLSLILKTVGATLITIKATQFLSWLTSMNHLVKRATIQFLRFTKVLSTNWITALASIVAFAGIAIWEWSDSVDAMNESLDKLNKAEAESILRITEFKNKIEENNAVINDETSSVEDLTRARESNKEILAELQSKYPQYYNGIQATTTGIISQTEALDKHTAALRANMVVQELAKGGFFSNSATKNYQNAVEELLNLQNKANRKIAYITNKQIELTTKLSKGKISQSEYDEENDKLAIQLSAWEQISKAEKMSDINKAATELAKIDDAMSAAVTAFRASIFNIANTNFLESLPTIGAEIKKLGPEEGAKWLDDLLVNMGISEKLIREEIERYLTGVMTSKGYIDFPLSFEFKDPEPEFEKWQKTFNQNLEEWGKETKAKLSQESAGRLNILQITPDRIATTTKDTLIKDAQEQEATLAATIKRIKGLQEKKGTLIGTVYEDENLKLLEAERKMNEYILSLFNADKKKENKVLSKRISLLKALYQSYEKLKAKYGDVKALGILEDSYSDDLQETFGGALSFDDLSFDNVKEGLKEALETLRPLAQKEGREAQNTLNKEISGVEVEIGFENVDKNNKKLKQQVDNLFAQFDLSRELEKLGLSEDLMKSLFDVEYLDLDSLTAKLEELKPQFKGGEMEDEYEQYVEKINKLSKKEQEQQAKDFVKFLTKKLGETTVLMQKKGGYLTYAQKLFNEGKITAEQYSEVVNKVIKETNEGISKVNLDLFKDSDTYIKAMGSLAGYTADELKNLRESLQNTVADSSQTFSADEINAYYDAIARITEQEQKLRKPWEKTGFGEIKYLNEQYKERKKLIKDSAQLEQEQTNLLKKQKNLEAKLATAKARGEDTSQLTQDIKDNAEALARINSEIKKNAAALAMVNGNIDKISNGLGDVWDKAAIGVAQVNNIAQGIKDSFNEIKDVAASFGVDTENESWTKAGIVIESFANATENASGMLTSLVSGDIGGTLKGLVGFVGSIIKGFNQFHDAKYDAIIKTEQKNVEKLAKAYDKLEKKIKDAMDVTQLQESTNAARENLEKQIESTQKMINAEEDKKDTDEEAVEEYKTNLDELNEKLKELEAERVKTLGGFGDIDAMKSATEEFVDAWMEAYKETGDGLDALEGKFNEFLENTIKKQIVMRGANNILKGLYENYDAMFSEDSAGGAILTPEEADAIRKLWEQSKQQLNDYLLNISKSLGLGTGEADGELSGLQAGIQGITESQAEIISAYLNSLRFFVSDNNSVMKQLRDYVIGTDDTANPMLAQLRIIAQQTSAMRTLLDSVTQSGHPKGHSGIRVFID